jgi:ATP phosphoribosyltransferase regulatory subunit HisZ
MAVLNTLLLPGMDNTPEFHAMVKGREGRETVAFQRNVLSMTMKNLTDTNDFSLLREFHRHVPQVRMIKEKVFRYGDR